jgi:hypothetical protein
MRMEESGEDGKRIGVLDFIILLFYLLCYLLWCVNANLGILTYA